MIKINLLSEGRKPAVSRRSKAKVDLSSQNLSAILLGLGLVLGILIGGAWKWVKNGELAREQAKVAQAQEELRKLEEILKEVEAFKKQQADLQTRITVIKGLMASRRGPVEVMDGVSMALPDLVWLTAMNVTDKSVELSGEAMNTNAIATFIENISRIPVFREPDTRDVVQSGPSLYTFSIRFPYLLKKPEDPNAAEQKPAGAKAPAGQSPT